MRATVCQEEPSVPSAPAPWRGEGCLERWPVSSLSPVNPHARVPCRAPSHPRSGEGVGTPPSFTSPVPEVFMEKTRALRAAGPEAWKHWGTATPSSHGKGRGTCARGSSSQLSHFSHRKHLLNASAALVRLLREDLGREKENKTCH